jgi:transposase
MMIDLYRSGTSAKQVAQKFGVSLRILKRLLHRHGVRRERCTPPLQPSNERSKRWSGTEGGSPRRRV